MFVRTARSNETRADEAPHSRAELLSIIRRRRARAREGERERERDERVAMREEDVRVFEIKKNKSS